MVELNPRIDHVRGEPDGGRVFERLSRDVDGGIATGEVRGTPTLFIDGAVHLGAHDADALVEALTR